MGGSAKERQRQQQRAIEAEKIWYQAMVQGPAFTMLRECKAARPGAMHKEPVTFAGATYYRQVLDDIDPRLPQHTGATPPLS